MGTKRFNPFSQGLWTYLSWLTDPTLALLVVRSFNLLSLVGGILQEECRTLLLTNKMSEYEKRKLEKRKLDLE